MKKRVLGVVVLLLAAVPANAQLLGSPQVRRELNISAPLASRIVAHLNEAARLRRGGVMTEKEWSQLEAQRRRTSPETLDREAMSWLSPAQKKRLQQIEWQRGTPFIVQDWKFARLLGMSREQHQKLQPAFDKSFRRYVRGVQALMKGRSSWYGRLDRQRYAARYAASDRTFARLGQQRTASVQAAVARSLTRAQKVKWQTLLGWPFRARLTYDTKSYPGD